MVSKIKKENFQTFQDKINKLDQIEKDLEAIYNAEPFKRELSLDIESFIEHHFDIKRNLNFYIKNNEKTITLYWNEPLFNLNLEFFGKGYWECNLTEKQIDKRDAVGTLSISWKGKAYDCMFKDTPEEVSYLFLLDPSMDKITYIKEDFEYEYSPQFKFSNSVSFPGKLTHAWRTDYYDGPISGYCYLNNELHWYDLEEECQYLQNRMYGLYKISAKQKWIAYYHRYKMFNIFGVSIMGKWYNIKRKVKKALNIKTPYKSPDKTKLKKELIGYFEF